MVISLSPPHDKSWLPFASHTMDLTVEKWSPIVLTSLVLTLQTMMHLSLPTRTPASCSPSGDQASAFRIEAHEFTTCQVCASQMLVWPEVLAVASKRPSGL